MAHPLNILVIGTGGREHALCWKINQSPLVNRLFCAPGNAGIAAFATCVELPNHPAILEFCTDNRVDLVVIGPEQYLVDGLADTLNEAGIAAFGCSAAAARLEGSKSFTKELCRKYNIPTAAYATFTVACDAEAYIREQGAPIVVKADGLAAGKGVTVALTVNQAIEAVQEAFSGKFGDAGNSVVIEEFMEGEEASFFALSDGRTVRAFASAQDHKAVGEGDSGANTGGMGTYSPTSLIDPRMEEQVMEEIILPTIRGMEAEGAPFTGVLFAGLMLTAQGPKLIEYNVRFGDPETQVVMARLMSDLVPLLLACANGEGLESAEITFTERAALCVVMAACGYPEAYKKGTVIRGLSTLSDLPDLVVFHAGTIEKDGKILANGGRVLGVTALGEDVADAQKNAYLAVDQINWPEGFCRRDIGWRAIARGRPS